MRTYERLLCLDCAKKLDRAELTYRRRPTKDNLAVCAFCHRERPCKCYQIVTGGGK